jgi:two-component system, response regulator PdtaR
MTKVLVVEDDPLISFGLTDEIEDAGHQVIGPAPSTGAALMQVRVEKPAVALIDLDLEYVHDGLELARVLKEMNIPSIVISHAEEKLLAAADVALGAALKPLSMAEVPAAIDVLTRMIRSGQRPLGLLPLSMKLFE